MKASDIMTLGAATVPENAPLARVIRTMLDHRISAVPVVDASDRLKGIISEGDFFRSDDPRFRLSELFAMRADDRAKSLIAHTVDEIMTRDPVAIGPDASAEQAIGLMERHTVKRLPVVSDGKVVGLISRTDLLRALIG